MTLREELSNNVYWEDTYKKMMSKQIEKSERENLWKLMEIYKADIIEELLNGSYKWSVPSRTEIAKSESKKKRVVYIYSTKDRYVLGVLYRALSNMFKDRVPDSCFSYKKGISTSSAIHYLRDNKTENLKYGVKMDIHAYFNSVSRQRVEGMLNELFKNNNDTESIYDTLVNLMLDDKVLWKGHEIKEWKSLIPGCALGSFFANYCLKECDEYFEKQGKVYARYSDDIIILSESKEELQKDIEVVKGFLNKYELTMNPDKYTWFEPGDSVEYLGLKLTGDKIDISDHAKKKIKKQIHRWCRKGRVKIERDNVPFELIATKIIKRLNYKNMFCAIDNEEAFGWCIYAFRYINTIETLREIDFYTRDTLRAMKTGRHNKANVKAISDEEFKRLGWVSLVEMFNLYKSDKDYYFEIVELMKNEGVNCVD